MSTSYDTPVVLDRREGPYGEVVLRRHGELLQIIANGCFLMDTSDGRSERLLIDAALDALPAGRRDPSVLIGGLGVGFSLVRAATESRWGRIAVVEREQAVVDWHLDGPLGRISGAALADPRTEILRTDLVDHLRTTTERYDALCLDIDNGPDWTVTQDNGTLYSPTGLAACRARLTPGGVLDAVLEIVQPGWKAIRSRKDDLVATTGAGPHRPGERGATSGDGIKRQQ